MTSKYGDMLKSQVEERLKFYSSGAAPRKNIDVMHAVSEELKMEMGGSVAVSAPAVRIEEMKVEAPVVEGMHT